jgi:hypothetical protein
MWGEHPQMRAEVMGEERAELQQIPAYKIPAERKNIKLQEDTDGWMDWSIDWCMCILQGFV